MAEYLLSFGAESALVEGRTLRISVMDEDEKVSASVGVTFLDGDGVVVAYFHRYGSVLEVKEFGSVPDALAWGTAFAYTALGEKLDRIAAGW